MITCFLFRRIIIINKMSVQICVRDMDDNVTVPVGTSAVDHLLGLGLDGHIRCNTMAGMDNEDIAIPLMRLVRDSGGTMTVTPSNKDLEVTIHQEPVTTQKPVSVGDIIEVAGKRIQILEKVNGKPKRVLPPTPGRCSYFPPEKPKRLSTSNHYLVKKEEKADENRLEEAVCMDTSLASWLSNYKKQSPIEHEVGHLTACCVIKHFNQQTDLRLSAEKADSIFKFFQEVSVFHEVILQKYLLDIAEIREKPEVERYESMHRPVIVLLVELLRQIMEPKEHVILCLELLRTLSHFPSNTPILVQCQASPAVLGIMTVYSWTPQVQEYAMNVLSKVALYVPKKNEKLPLRETAVDLILKALSNHKPNKGIVTACIATLSNLTYTLETMLNICFDSSDEYYKGMHEFFHQLLEKIYTESEGHVLSCLMEYPQDITIKVEGRKFLCNYSRMKCIKPKMLPIHTKENASNAPKPSMEGYLQTQAVNLENSETKKTNCCPKIDKTTEDVLDQTIIDEKGENDYSIQEKPANNEFKAQTETTLVMRKDKSSTSENSLCLVPGKLVPSKTPDDKEFLLYILRAVVLQATCSLLEAEENKTVLTVLDKPLLKLISFAQGQSSFLKLFVNYFEEDDSLLDIDSAFLIKIIDALRYNCLLHNVLEIVIMETWESLQNRTDYDSLLMNTCVSSFHHVLQDKSIQAILQEPSVRLSLKKRIEETDCEKMCHDSLKCLQTTLHTFIS